jgi:hypothetical protein
MLVKLSWFELEYVVKDPRVTNGDLSMVHEIIMKLVFDENEKERAGVSEVIESVFDDSEDVETMRWLEYNTSDIIKKLVIFLDLMEIKMGKKKLCHRSIGSTKEALERIEMAGKGLVDHLVR